MMNLTPFGTTCTQNIWSNLYTLQWALVHLYWCNLPWHPWHAMTLKHQRALFRGTFKSYRDHFSSSSQVHVKTFNLDSSSLPNFCNHDRVIKMKNKCHFNWRHNLSYNIFKSIKRLWPIKHRPKHDFTIFCKRAHPRISIFDACVFHYYE